METADEVFIRHGTDKGWAHHYGPIYDRLFPNRAGVGAVLEIGVMEGRSLLAWHDLFPAAIIVGLDLHPLIKGPIPDRVEVHQGDAANRRILFATVGDRQFDLIVDDASHQLDHQLTTLFHLWPALRAGGHYVIEEFDILSPDRTWLEDFRQSISLFHGAWMEHGALAVSQLLILSK